MDHRDAQVAQVVCRSHTGQHENLRGLNGSGTEDDVLRFDDEGLSAAVDLDANRLLAAEENAPDQRVGLDAQILAVTAGVQVGQGRAHADAIRVVQRKGADATGGGMVQVRIIGDPGVETGLIKCRLEGDPMLPMMTTHRDGAISAMELVLDIEVPFPIF